MPARADGCGVALELFAGPNRGSVEGTASSSLYTGTGTGTCRPAP